MKRAIVVLVALVLVLVGDVRCMNRMVAQAAPVRSAVSPHAEHP
jgi:hypothetical protein